MAGIMDGDSSGRVYRAVHGHMTARYWYRHATWNVACSLSGKVTVTASPCTGVAHHAQGRTGFPCLLRGRAAFAMLLPFMCSATAKPPTRPAPRPPPGHAGSLTTLPRSSQRYAWRREDARDTREDGGPIWWTWS